MKKLSLTKQIVLIFTVVFILISLFITVLISRRLNYVYEEQIYNIIENNIERNWKALVDDNRKGELSDIHFIIGSSRNIILKSHNLEENINEDSINTIVDSAAKKRSRLSQRYKLEQGNKEIYYVVYKPQGLSSNYVVGILDDSYKTSLLQNTVIPIIRIIMFIFIIGLLIILIWVNYLVKRVKAIHDDILHIQDSNYQNSYIDKGNDEIGDLSKIIDKMRIEILNKERDKQEMMQNISHDLKTPISVIKSYAESIEDGIGNSNESARVIIKQSDRLNSKVSNLIRLTKLEYIANKVYYNEINIKDIIISVVKQYKHVENIEFKLELNELCFNGEEEAWRVAIENIIENGIRYAKNEIRIVLKENTLIISNDGKHIENNIIDTMFEPYKKGNDGKFGLGMSIVYKTVTVFGYNIKAENTEYGVEFKIYK